jgi:hypothetical protein
MGGKKKAVVDPLPTEDPAKQKNKDKELEDHLGEESKTQEDFAKKPADDAKEEDEELVRLMLHTKLESKPARTISRASTRLYYFLDLYVVVSARRKRSGLSRSG